MICIKFDNDTIPFFSSTAYTFDINCMDGIIAEDIPRESDLGISFDYEHADVCAITGLVEFDKNTVTLSKYFVSKIT
jgi:hypothetical protein